MHSLLLPAILAQVCRDMVVELFQLPGILCTEAVQVVESRRRKTALLEGVRDFLEQAFELREDSHGHALLNLEAVIRKLDLDGIYVGQYTVLQAAGENIP